MYRKIGFIGTGNMGSALASAVAKSGIASADALLLSNRTPAKAQAVATALGLADTAVVDNTTIAADCDLIFLGVKPQMMADMLETLHDPLFARATAGDPFVLCTMAAGLSCERIRAMAGLPSAPVIRIMPNTPAAIGKGVIQVCSLGVTEQQLSDFELLLAPAGLVDRIDEHLIDAASAVSGCGPAFAYLFAEALADGAVACGLPRSKAITYAAAMLEGSAALVLESGKHPGVLKDAVCSPGGTTIQGVRVLEENGFRGAVMDAVIAAYEKTVGLR